MENIILPNTSLCAIVRDEKINPAGGIKRFINSHVPYVEKAVIVDTGSIDGTREILEEMESKYSNLKIFDHKFEGFADARNYSLKQAETKYVLVLDADELLTHEKPQNDWKILNKWILDGDLDSYEGGINFSFIGITFKGNPTLQMEVHNPRFFQNPNKPIYIKKSWETNLLYFEENSLNQNDVLIKHFIPRKDALRKKMIYWYLPKKFERSPTKVKGFEEWTKFNPERDNFI